jgi:hypothetical protein
MHAAGFLTDCQSAADHGDPLALFYSTWAAAQVASALNTANQAIPDGDDYTAALIGTGVAWGVANALYLALNDVLSATLDCLTADSNAVLVSAYPKDASGNYTPASSQKAVDALSSIVKGNSEAIDGIAVSVNGTTMTLADVINEVGAAQAAPTRSRRPPRTSRPGPGT